MTNDQHWNSVRKAISGAPNSVQPLRHAFYHSVIDIKSRIEWIDHWNSGRKSVFGVANGEDVLYVRDLFVNGVVVWSVNRSEHVKLTVTFLIRENHQLECTCLVGDACHETTQGIAGDVSVVIKHGSEISSEVFWCHYLV
jgi:hypothetical protein